MASLLSCSAEILYIIIKHVESKCDLQSLCLVNRHLRTLAVDQLYHSICISHRSASQLSGTIHKIETLINSKHLDRVRHLRLLHMDNSAVLSATLQLLERIPSNQLRSFRQIPVADWVKWDVAAFLVRQTRLERAQLNVTELSRLLGTTPEILSQMKDLKKLGLYYTPDKEEVTFEQVLPHFQKVGLHTLKMECRTYHTSIAVEVSCLESLSFVSRLKCYDMNFLNQASQTQYTLPNLDAVHLYDCKDINPFLRQVVALNLKEFRIEDQSEHEPEEGMVQAMSHFLSRCRILERLKLQLPQRTFLSNEDVEAFTCSLSNFSATLRVLWIWEENWSAVISSHEERFHPSFFQLAKPCETLQEFRLGVTGTDISEVLTVSPLRLHRELRQTHYIPGFVSL